MAIRQIASVKQRMPLLRNVHIGRYIPLTIRWGVARLVYAGNNRYCPVCESNVGQFWEAGQHFRRKDGECPVCHSWERHRLGWYFLEHNTSLLDRSASNEDRQVLLHMAPETQLRQRLSHYRHLRYVTADLYADDVDVQLDLLRIPIVSGGVSAIYCSHVLEHVHDDKAVMREFWRVLKPGGWCIIMVPMHEQPTIEDPSITDPAERLRLFGQEDHVRIYGSDIKDRLEGCGFTTTLFQTETLVGAEAAERMGIRGERLYFCTKS